MRKRLFNIKQSRSLMGDRGTPVEGDAIGTINDQAENHLRTESMNFGCKEFKLFIGDNGPKLSGQFW